jgi:YVTN family beta-propeller protein
MACPDGRAATPYSTDRARFSWIARRPAAWGALALALLLLGSLGGPLHAKSLFTPQSAMAEPSTGVAPGSSLRAANTVTGPTALPPGTVADSMIPAANTSVRGNLLTQGMCNEADAFVPPNSVWVSNDCTAPSPISVVNATTGAVTASLGGASSSSGLAYDAAQGVVFVLNLQNGTVEVLGALTGAIVNAGVPIPAGTTASAIAYDPTDGDVFVVNAATDSVTVLSATTDRIVNPGIAVGYSPDALAVDPVRNTIFVANQVYGNVTVISGATLTPVASFGTGSYFVGLAVDVADQTVYVTDLGYDYVWVYNASSYAYETYIPLSISPDQIAFDPVNRFVYVADEYYGEVYAYGATNFTEIGSGTVVGAATYYGQYLAVDPYSGALFVSSPGFGNLSVVQGISVVHPSIPLLWDVGPLAFDGVHGRMYAILQQPNAYATNFVVGIDPRTFRIATPLIPVGYQASAIVFDGATGDLYVANEYSDNISVIDPSTGASVASIYVGYEPDALLLDPLNGHLYVASYGEADVWAIDPATNSLLSPSIPVGSGPSGLALDPTNGHLFVANANSGNVSVIDTEAGSVVANVALDYPYSHPVQVAYDPVDGEMYVTAEYQGAVYAINSVTNTIDARVPTPYNPVATAFDPINDGIYVTLDSGYAPYAAGDVLVINGASLAATTAPASFTPVGLGPYSILYAPTFGVGAPGALWIGNYYAGTISILGNALSSVGLVASPATVDQGGQTMLVAIAAGGSGGLNFAYANLPPGCASTNTARLACAPNATGAFTPSVTVTDALGQSLTATASLTVGPAFRFTASAPAAAHVGEGLRFDATPSGGVGPYHIAWSFGDGSGSTGASPSHAFAAAGTYTVEVWANDSANGTEVRQFTLSVSSASASFLGSTALGGNVGMLLGLLIGFVAALAAVLVLRRRRAPPSVSSPVPEYAVTPPPPPGAMPPPGGSA